MALLELTDKCLGENDPHVDLYDELFNALYTIDNNKKNDNTRHCKRRTQNKKLAVMKTTNQNIATTITQ